MRKLSNEELADLQSALKSQKENSLNESPSYCSECGYSACICDLKSKIVEKAREGVAETAERESRFFNSLGGILFLILGLLILKALNLI